MRFGSCRVLPGLSASEVIKHLWRCSSQCFRLCHRRTWALLGRRSSAWSGIRPAPDVVDHPVLYAIIYVTITALHPELGECYGNRCQATFLEYC
jgi:hypothetical protein